MLALEGPKAACCVIRISRDLSFRFQLTYTNITQPLAKGKQVKIEMVAVFYIMNISVYNAKCSWKLELYIS